MLTPSIAEIDIPRWNVSFKLQGRHTAIAAAFTLKKKNLPSLFLFVLRGFVPSLFFLAGSVFGVFCSGGGGGRRAAASVIRIRGDVVLFCCVCLLGSFPSLIYLRYLYSADRFAVCRSARPSSGTEPDTAP
jgi:hypothetical protein